MTDPNLVRRLTTILAIDVVAFSAMSARDEEHALGLLGTRLDTAGTLVRQHRGRVFKMTGDGLLAEFASPVEAVRAALEIQEAMRSANAPPVPTISSRCASASTWATWWKTATISWATP